ncbi:MAG: asparaginase [Hyphomicrobiales bacterium]|nr:asparaginase [Hyphomicrobiales bacterium]
MNNPVLVEVTRGGIVESRHHASYAVCGPDGKLIAQAGDIALPVFPRSAVKAFQALAMVEAGVADEFGFDDAEIALACSSHNGEPAHIEMARSMLAKAGIAEDAYECGPHWPSHEEASHALAAAGGEPQQVHNNCSGKHSGMLAFAKHLGVDVKGYTRPEHPVQQQIAAVMTELCDANVAAAPCGIDGCSVPTWALPLKAWALGFARFAGGNGLSAKRRAAAKRIIAAVRTHPFMVAGTGRFCTELMEAVPRAFVKTGAEGVFCGAVPHAGIGIALKCDDGASRAAEKLMARLLIDFGGFDANECEALEGFAATPVLNRANIETGVLRAISSR